MEHMNTHHQKGFIKWIIIIVIALIILSAYGYDIRSAVESPTAKRNFSYVGETVSSVWNHYLKDPATRVWNFTVDAIASSTVTKLKK